MKKLLLSIILMFYVFNISGGIKAKQENKSEIILVIANNPAFIGGPIIAANLPSARAMAKVITSLDPVCQAVAQLCIDRYNNTVYEVIHNDGTIDIVH